MVIGHCAPPADVAPDAQSSVDAPKVEVPKETLRGPTAVTITADNAYSFGYGSSGAVTHFTQGQRATEYAQIFNCPVGLGPEFYEIAEEDAPSDGYLYIIAWDDLSVKQGVIGQFKRDNATVYTGDAKFEVCATGRDYSRDDLIPSGEGDSMNGPTLAVINAEIANCNSGGAAVNTSGGWVNSAGSVTPGAIGVLAVGDANDGNPNNTNALVCPQSAAQPDGIDAAANGCGTFRMTVATPTRLSLAAQIDFGRF